MFFTGRLCKGLGDSAAEETKVQFVREVDAEGSVAQEVAMHTSGKCFCQAASKEIFTRVD